MAEEHGLIALPPELTCEILRYLPAHMLIRVGQTCQQLRTIVNDPFLSKRIIDRERTRLLESQRPPSLAGLSLLEAFRKWVLYTGRLRPRKLHRALHLFALKYMSANGLPEEGVTCKTRGLLKELTEYLYHLDHAAHYDLHHPGPDANGDHAMKPCLCDRCRRERPEGGNHCWIEKLVREPATQERRHGNGARGFWNSCASSSPRAFVTEKEWMAMVQDVIREPIQQYSHTERGRVRKLLWKVLHHEITLRPSSWRWQNEMEVFLALAELPSLDKRAIRRGATYMTKMDPSKVKEIKSFRHSLDKFPDDHMKGAGMIVRAITELVRIESGQKTGPEKLVDPHSRLLRAHIFEQVQILTDGTDDDEE